MMNPGITVHFDEYRHQVEHWHEGLPLCPNCGAAMVEPRSFWTWLRQGWGLVRTPHWLRRMGV